MPILLKFSKTYLIRLFHPCPSGFVKTYFDGPVSFDANLNALFYEKFELGASYRLDDSFGALVGFL